MPDTVHGEIHCFVADRQSTVYQAGRGEASKFGSDAGYVRLRVTGSRTLHDRQRRRTTCVVEGCVERAISCNKGVCINLVSTAWHSVRGFGSRVICCGKLYIVHFPLKHIQDHNFNYHTASLRMNRPRHWKQSRLDASLQ